MTERSPQSGTPDTNPGQEPQSGTPETSMFELISRCRLCGGDRLDDILDLGEQPPANALRLPTDRPPQAFPLAVVRCGSCATAQLTATVDPVSLFGDYVWVTGTASTTQAFSSDFCRQVLDRWADQHPKMPVDGGLVVEVASNDGTFLKRFQERGWRVLGVDPARNIVTRAVSDGVPTVCDYFNVDVAREISRQSAADIVIARNVIPHVADIHGVIEGMADVLHDDGLAVIEFHYAGAILDDLQYDSIYHEHLFYFTLETLGPLCASYGLVPFDVTESPISGGALVLFLSKAGRQRTDALNRFIQSESTNRINSLESWREFAGASRSHAEALASQVVQLSREGAVVGYGASARSSTLLNASGVTSEHIEAVIDRNELKHGHLMPGSDIPIVSYDDGRSLLKEADSLVLLAWNFETEIVADLRSEGFEGGILVPLPREPRVR